MNILPKKNWHVLKKENIFKVKADIAKAKAEEDDHLRKSEISNQETYLSILRSKTKTSNFNSVIGAQEISSIKNSDPMHIQKPKNNIEHEIEKKEVQEKHEKNIGLLTYLGQSVLDSKDDLWWTKTNKKNASQLTDDKKRKQEYLIRKEDPLEAIMAFQDSIDKQKELTKSLVGPRIKPFPKEDFIQKTTKKSKHSHKKSKKKHRRSSSESDSSYREKKINKKQMKTLRKERIEREKVEKIRAECVTKSGSRRLFPI